MDARRFDGFSKAWSAGTSRRRVLKAFPAVALGSIFPVAARADHRPAQCAGPGPGWTAPAR